ncbi:MAG: PPC domain-containing protein [Gemmatimonadota bacterium]|nr:MAG: PPC domain-containing protein [Gemmatimonadota bacterium]
MRRVVRLPGAGLQPVEVMTVLSVNRPNVVVSVVLCALLLGSTRYLEAQAGASILSLLEARGQLSVGGEVRGALSSSDHRSARDAYMEAWALEGQAGESVTVDLISDDFDAYLYVVGPGMYQTLSDDDSGGACHARITFTFLEDGTFRVVASSTGPRQTGIYSLRVSDKPGPTAAYSCGGINPALLSDLPIDGRTLRVGEVASGALTASSSRPSGGAGAEAWGLEGRAGESVTVVLESDAFDAYLLVSGPGLSDVLTDDDGAGDLNSQITLTFPADGTYLVVASSVAESAVGPYTLRVTEPLDINELPTAERIIEVGGTMTGWLSSADPIIGEGRRGEAWALMGRAGQIYTIDLESSEFDCYLMVVGPGFGEPLVDDDSGGDLDSRIRITLPEDGTYRVIVSSAGSGETGEYSLRVEEAEG